MENFEFNSQICTSVEQSKRLLELGLKKETADMAHNKNTIIPKYKIVQVDDWFLLSEVVKSIYIPAWSLHRLLCLIPKEVNIDGFKFPLRSDVIMRLEDVDFMYERLIGIIERVIKEGYFNKDYLEEKK